MFSSVDKCRRGSCKIAHVKLYVITTKISSIECSTQFEWVLISRKFIDKTPKKLRLSQVSIWYHYQFDKPVVLLLLLLCYNYTLLFCLLLELESRVTSNTTTRIIRTAATMVITMNGVL